MTMEYTLQTRMLGCMQDLKLYRDWLVSTGGQGSGLERESLEHLLGMDTT